MTDTILTERFLEICGGDHEIAATASEIANLTAAHREALAIATLISISRNITRASITLAEVIARFGDDAVVNQLDSLAEVAMEINSNLGKIDTTIARAK